MKKIILLAAFGVAGMLSAKTSNKEGESKSKVFYHPIVLTSSCGYTQVVEVGPNDQPDCWMTDAQQMEDECASPFTNPRLAGINWT
ncbi:hypothetical protein [Chryseobacterium gambrini]|uniref:Uncharacterized protein n=1 Tax=Chryseobacterium gambrini TaxID=373672 RepID=A0A1N7QAE4_9FLAO|nr:hypothetical protein [Chryseobacterium gambrini]SIT19784.1 hypothetical protein SAMN05421785_11027 [Chryseobacterium gambrini]